MPLPAAPRTLALALALTLAPAAALAFEPVPTRDAFLSTVVGRPIVHRLLGVEIVVNADGTISGQAQGWAVTGSWSWEGSYLCRQMDWSGTAIPYNCQLVEVEPGRVRFTSDHGTGDSATFGLG
ncbi:hypothetical protein [Wenxinia marina]|uniref:Dihydrodipicolinate reductase n=1 Tax=Wenxinia marina DSM 24838 TaxID=1123501 RepID=A0A0D0QIE2_9RHOB|nr:hypothetical protein [Wenxinia marina]KIQ70818.1 hypothetical protein Wenmar_00192 [Wenxinia marina DSM 24838]GGL57056.1 hypothetical protein GCM10011392_09410 [Wenxinia marina]